VAIVKASQNTGAAQDYIDYLFSTKAKDIFEKFGFTTISK
jgi:ABC-type molybdate transport system substrate-binding protein